MERREAVRYITALLGSTLVGSEIFLSGCKSIDNKKIFSPGDITFLDEVAETIIPATDIPGAKAAKVGDFMTVMVTDCYDKKQQDTFYNGINKINELSQKEFGKNFININPQQRHTVLSKLDKEQKEFMKYKKDNETTHYFRMMKELTLLGYFTSEIGCTQAKRYIPVPGRFEGCIPYKKGDKAFA